MPAPIKDMAGARVAGLTVLEMVPHVAGMPVKWVCRCDCGQIHVRTRQALQAGIAPNCRCRPWRKVNRIGDITRTHGQSNSATYTTWRAMVERCNNKNAIGYPNYGGRGIRVCDRWLTFENFFADMGERQKGMTLDRIDVDGDYEPANCAWSTRKQQGRNKRNNRLITHDGRTMCLAEWAEAAGMTTQVLGDRIGKLGWNFSEAISRPPRRLKKHSHEANQK